MTQAPAKMTWAARRAGARRYALVPLIVLLPLLAGCGGSAGQNSTAAGAPRPTIASGPVLHATATAVLAPAPFLPLPLPLHGLAPADTPAIVATMNGKPVAAWLYRSQVNFQLSLRERSPAPGTPAPQVTPAELRTIERQALIAVIENALLVSYGEAHGWAPSAAEVADAYQLVIQRRGGEAASLRQVASEYLTVDQDRIVMRNRLVTQQVLDHFLAGLHQPVQTVQYRMIVTTSRAQAEQVRALLQRSDRWVDLAARYSLDPVGKAQGGEQPFLTKGRGNPALAARIFSLPIGKLSAPFQLKRGWAVIEVLRRLPSPDQLQQDNARYYAWIDALLRKARITSYISLA